GQDAPEEIYHPFHGVCELPWPRRPIQLGVQVEVHVMAIRVGILGEEMKCKRQCGWLQLKGSVVDCFGNPLSQRREHCILIGVSQLREYYSQDMAFLEPSKRVRFAH